MKNTAVVLIDCPDRKGLVAAVAGILYRYGANIVHADQHQDPEAGLFFMRVEWALDEFDLDAFRAEFQTLASETPDAVAHRVDVATAASCALRFAVPALPRRCSPQTTGRRTSLLDSTNHRQPRRWRAAGTVLQCGVSAHSSDCGFEKGRLAVLARYMQILSPEFVQQYPLRIMNVHHSFLPAFIGKDGLRDMCELVERETETLAPFVCQEGPP